MLEYLIQIPFEAVGQKMLGFLELIDIVQWENASASQMSQQLLREILPYCPPFVVSDSWSRIKFNHIVCDWFSSRGCRVQFMRIPIESLCEVNFEHSVMYGITLCLKEQAPLNAIVSLTCPDISNKITKLQIKDEQDPAVMEVLFSLLTNCSVCSLDIPHSKLSQWVEHIKKIGSCLLELTIYNIFTELTELTAITKCCPNLEKLSSRSVLQGSQHNFLESIANNCHHLRSLHQQLSYHISAEADADLTAFAEKCPQLEELTLHCPQLTDQSVIALAQYCSRLKKLKSDIGRYTTASLITLSERGLPLEELDIPWIPISSAEIAAQCAHALSGVGKYMTGLRELVVNSSKDHLLVPHLLQLLQGYGADVESLSLHNCSSITPQQFIELVAGFTQLHTLSIFKHTCSSDAVVVELARSCPHLQKVTLFSSDVTEEGVLALAAHCRQLREIDISKTIVTEETVRQLVQHCRRLTKLDVSVYIREGEEMVKRGKHYTSKEIRALRL